MPSPISLSRVGAARFGKLLHGHAGRIAAGAARAVFLQAQTG